VSEEDRKDWLDLKNRALFVKSRNISKKTFQNKRTKQAAEINLFEALCYNAEKEKVLVQCWGEIAEELDKYFAKYDDPNKSVLMVFDEEVDSKAVSQSNPKRMGFERVEPNRYQVDTGVESVLALKSAHLPFSPSAMPRPMKWRGDIYCLNGELLDHPQDWADVPDVIPDSAGDADLGFIDFDEASPVKKSKPSV